MALRKRAPGLACLLLLTAAALLLAGHRAPAVPPGPAAQESVQTMEEDTIHYEEQPSVRVLSLRELEPTDTSAAANPLWGAETALSPVSPAEMAEILAELHLNDGTSIRLYATAEGLVFGAFLRPGGQWTRFAQLRDGTDRTPDYAAGATLTAFSDVLGHDGFLLRTDAHSAGCYDYRYYWIAEDGSLQVLSAAMDPVSLDMDGDGQAELAYNFNGWQGPFTFCYRRPGGEICQVTPAAYLDQEDLTLERIEAEGPGPVRLIYAYRAEGEERFCAVTFQEETLRLEWDIVYVPGGEPEDAVAAPALPDPSREPWTAVTLTAPDGWVMDGAGVKACRLLWWFAGTELVPTDAPMDEEAAYTLEVTGADGETVTWTVDAEGICRLEELAGNYRILRTGSGSPAACFYNLLQVCCDASRTSRIYDGQGRWLGAVS